MLVRPEMTWLDRAEIWLEQLYTYLESKGRCPGCGSRISIDREGDMLTPLWICANDEPSACAYTLDYSDGNLTLSGLSNKFGCDTTKLCEEFGKLLSK